MISEKWNELSEVVSWSAAWATSGTSLTTNLRCHSNTGHWEPKIVLPRGSFDFSLEHVREGKVSVCQPTAAALQKQGDGTLPLFNRASSIPAATPSSHTCYISAKSLLESFRFSWHMWCFHGAWQCVKSPVIQTFPCLFPKHSKLFFFYRYSLEALGEITCRKGCLVLLDPSPASSFECHLICCDKADDS